MLLEFCFLLLGEVLLMTGDELPRRVCSFVVAEIDAAV